MAGDGEPRAWTSGKRREVWSALMRDDPRALSAQIKSRADVDAAATQLWRPGKRAGIADKRLLDVVLLQATGVNGGKGGALRCWEWLHAAHGDAFSAADRAWVRARLPRPPASL